MQLLSVNIALTKEVDYKGKMVSTGIFKESVHGSVTVNRLKLEGDQQADLTVHGGVDKAVYLYPTEHFAFWKKQYPHLDFTCGSFGENLSTSGLLESEVSIGDTFSIGTAEFMVTSPRLPCFKLGLKMGDPGIIKAFLQANRNGFYLKVLKEGSIEAGQSIIPTGSDGSGFKVDEFSALYALDKDNIELLGKALNAPNVPNGWKEFFQKRLNESTATL